MRHMNYYFFFFVQTTSYVHNVRPPRGSRKPLFVAVENIMRTAEQRRRRRRQHTRVVRFRRVSRGARQNCMVRETGFGIGTDETNKKKKKNPSQPGEKRYVYRTHVRYIKASVTCTAFDRCSDDDIVTFRPIRRGISIYAVRRSTVPTPLRGVWNLRGDEKRPRRRLFRPIGCCASARA